MICLPAPWVHKKAVHQLKKALHVELLTGVIWLTMAWHGMAWHSCNATLGFIVNAFISVYHHLSKHNKRAELKLNGRSARLLRAY